MVSWLEKIREGGKKFLYGDDSAFALRGPNDLPYSVVEAMVGKANRETKEIPLDAKGFKNLIQDGDSETKLYQFVNPALYLLLKSCTEDPDTQRELLAEIVPKLQNIDTENDTAVRMMMRDFIAEALPRLEAKKQKEGSEWYVDGKHLRRFHRLTFKEMDARCALKAKELAKSSYSIVLVGNSMFYGLSAFVRECKKANKPLYILMPDFIPDPLAERKMEHAGGNQPCGYVIEPDGNVRGLRQGFRRPKDAVIVDDIEDSGETRGRVTSFYAKQSQGDDVPMFTTIASMDAVLESEEIT